MEHVTPGSAVTHVTDCAMRPGYNLNMPNMNAAHDKFRKLSFIFGEIDLRLDIFM